MAKTRECCSALSLRRTGDDLHVSLHKDFKIRLAGIVPVSLEFTDIYTLRLIGSISYPGECDLMVQPRKYSVIFS